MFYERLNKICKSNGTTVTALLKKLNLAKQNGTSWKNGGSPSVEVLQRISEELNTSIDFLLTGEYKNNISESETEMLEIYRELTEEQRGEVKYHAKQLAENNKEDSKNV